MISILKITKRKNSAKRYNFHTNHIQITKGHKTAKNVGVTVYNQSLVILLFVPSFVKLSRTVSKLQSGHDFYATILKGE